MTSVFQDLQSILFNVSINTWGAKEKINRIENPDTKTNRLCKSNWTK